MQAGYIAAADLIMPNAEESACGAGGVHTAVFCGIEEHLAKRELLEEPLAHWVEMLWGEAARTRHHRR